MSAWLSPQPVLQAVPALAASLHQALHLLRLAPAAITATTLLLLMGFAAATARPRADEHRIIVQESDPESPPNRSGTPLANDTFQDTVSYGGTYWAPDSMRWEM